MRNVVSNVLVAYATQHGSTEKIANILADSISGNATVKNVKDVNSLDYEYIVLGSSIYNEEPLDDMKNFINKYNNELKTIKKSAFIVTSDIENQIKKEKNLNSMKRIIPGDIDVIRAFSGEIDYNGLNQYEKESVNSYLNSIQKPVGTYSKLNTRECEQFGKEISKYII